MTCPGHAAGASGYVPKSAAGREIMAAIRDVMKGKAVLHPDLVRQVMQKFDPFQDSLTPRELEILKLLGNGMRTRNAAVKTHLRGLFRKFDVTSRTELVIQAMQKGFLDPSQRG